MALPLAVFNHRDPNRLAELLDQTPCVLSRLVVGEIDIGRTTISIDTNNEASA